MRGECAALPTGGIMQVTRAGKTTPEWAFVARHVAPVVGRGDRLLLIEDAGQLFVVAILGESPAVPPVVAPGPPAEGAPETGARMVVRSRSISAVVSCARAACKAAAAASRVATALSRLAAETAFVENSSTERSASMIARS